MAESHQNTLAELENKYTSEVNTLKKALDKELIENNAIKAIEKEKGNSFFLLPHMKDKIKTVQDEQGNFSVQVVDEDGNPRMHDDQSKPFSVADLVAEFKSNDHFALAFRK